MSSKKKRKLSSNTLNNNKIGKKKTKKDKTSQKKQETISSLCNVVGITQNEPELDPFGNIGGGVVGHTSVPSQHGNEELDDCLALMDQVIYTQTSTSVSSKAKKSDVKSSSNQVNGGSTQPTTLTLKENVPLLWRGQKNDNLNIRYTPNHMKTLSSQTALNDFSLPNIQIELTRHKLLGEASQYLLSKCPKLRMPSFERWLIDSKVEEREKRNMIEEMNKKIEMAEENARQQHQQFYHKKNKEIKWKQRLKRKRDELKSSLDRHLTSSGTRTLNDYDCVLPAMADVQDEASQRLMEEIQSSFEESGIDNEDDPSMKAKSICKELCQKACSSGRHVQNLNQHLGGPVHVSQYFPAKNSKKSTSHSIGKIILENQNKSESFTSSSSDSVNTTYSLIYSRKSKKGNDAKPFVVKINAQHYEKLRDMFHSVHDSNHKMRVVPTKSLRREKDYDPGTKVFLHLVFCLLVRYASLSGGQQLLDLRGGGMQGAIHSQVFDRLTDLCDNESVIECFASPLNVYNNRYCSIFHQDIDYHFGSIGDFFTVPLGHFNKHGGNIHEANPPFAPGLMASMVNRLEEHLQHADVEGNKSNGNGELSFVVIVPTCVSNKHSKEATSSDNKVHSFASESFRNMIKSRYFSKHIILKAREHGYVEGSQHLRQTRYKESQYSTSIVILQSKKAKERENDDPIITTDEFESAMRKSFSSLHKLETEQRRADALGDVTKKTTGKDGKGTKKSKKRKH